MKRYYFNKKNKTHKKWLKTYIQIIYLLNIYFILWSQASNGTISKNTLLFLVIVHIVFDNP